MFKSAVVIFAVIACVAAKPGLLGAAPLAYTAPVALVAPAPVVTATSSQVIARNYNGIAHAPIVAAAPVAPLARIAAPVARIAAPVAVAHAAYSSPLVSQYAAAAPLAYSAPLSYASHLGYSAPLLW